MGNMSVRGLDDKLVAALKNKARREATSVNAMTVRLLEEATGLRGPRGEPAIVHHDLDALAGTWSARDEKSFSSAIKSLSEVDPGIWEAVGRR